MRGILSVLAALAVIGLAFWAYRETHQTQRSLADLRQTQFEVATLREAMGVQRAEWAYLNRPARLRELVELNFDRLGLMPLSPAQFGNMDQVAYPAPELPALEQPVETSGEIGAVTALAGTLPDDAPKNEDGLEP
jgi:hypothetical protein